MALWHATKSGFYMTIGDDQLSGWTDKKLQSTFQSQTCTHKKCYCHCLMVCCPSDPLWLSESWWNHYIWDVCSANRWNASKPAMPAASIGQQKGPSSSPWQFPTARRKSMFQKLNKLGYKACLICHIHLISCQLTTLIQASWQLFIGKTLLQLAVSRKCFPRVCWTLKHRLLCYRKKILISCWQKCFDHNGSYFD